MARVVVSKVAWNRKLFAGGAVSVTIDALQQQLKEDSAGEASADPRPKRDTPRGDFLQLKGLGKMGVPGDIYRFALRRFGFVSSTRSFSSGGVPPRSTSDAFDFTDDGSDGEELDWYHTYGEDVYSFFSSDRHDPYGPHFTVWLPHGALWKGKEYSDCVVLKVVVPGQGKDVIFDALRQPNSDVLILLEEDEAEDEKNDDEEVEKGPTISYTYQSFGGVRSIDVEVKKGPGICFPADLFDGDSIDSDFKDGVVTIWIPKDMHSLSCELGTVESTDKLSKEVQASRSGETKQTAEDLDEFLNKVRRGEHVSNDEIWNFAKLFNDELTLDNMSRPRLVNMCKYMGICPFGTDHYLRFMLRKKLRDIKNDDKMIQAEGVESLSEDELRQACWERGHLGLLSTEEMRQQLRDWLDLSLNHAVPSSLLILSRAFTVSGRMKPEEAVVATLSSLPDEVVDTVGTVLPSEDSVSERRKLEFLEMQEELIKEEEKKKEKEEKAIQKKEEEAKLEEPKAAEEDLALKEMADATAREELTKAKEHDKEKLCNISRALAVLASASSVSKERQEFLSLVNKEIELYNSMLEKEGTEGEEEAKKAYIAAREEPDHDADVAAEEKVSSALIEKVDAMLQKLEKEIDDVDAQIGNRWQLLDRDHDGKVTPEEVAAAAAYLKDTIGKEGVQELIGNLSKDREGKILVEDIVRLASQTEEHNDEEEEEEPRQ